MANYNEELVRLLVALTPKEQQYVQLRAQGLNKAAASRGAGFSNDKEGIRLEKREDVQQALVAAREDSVQTMRITRDDVLRGFMDAVRASATATELTAAWREIGRMLGHYEPEKKVMEVNQNIQKSVKHMRALPDDQLAEIAGMDKNLLLEGDYEVIGDDDDNSA